MTVSWENHVREIREVFFRLRQLNYSNSSRLKEEIDLLEKQFYRLGRTYTVKEIFDEDQWGTFQYCLTLDYLVITRDGSDPIIVTPHLKEARSVKRKDLSIDAECCRFSWATSVGPELLGGSAT